MNPFTLIILSILVATAPYLYKYLIFKFTGDYNKLYSIKRKHRRMQQEMDNLLSSRFRYYAALSPEGKNKFLARLCYVLDKVEFVGYQGLEITDDMRTCVLFSQIQLTFGMKLFYFSIFKRYILYPESFYSRFFNRDLLGLTSAVGFVTLSWHDFQEGYLVPNDKYNLGLHEMAHALRLELSDTFNNESLVQQMSDKMDDQALIEKNMVSRGVPSILREYAYTNNEEFFSVCVEYFFEVPALLKEYKPEIFSILCRMLNQNTLNVNSDYNL